MDTARLIDAIDADARRFAEVAGRLDADTPVPTCPGWDVEHLVRHLGTVHRWATDIVVHARTERPRHSWFAPAPDVALPAWFETGRADLIAALRAAPDDLDCFTLYPGLDGRRFWAVRQAVETALHRADVELAAGSEPAWDEDLAALGITEILGAFAGPRREGTFTRTGVLEIAPADAPAWTLRITADELTATEGRDGPAQAHVHGANGQVLLWLWNRPSAAVVEGDPALAGQWSEQVRI